MPTNLADMMVVCIDHFLSFCSCLTHAADRHQPPQAVAAIPRQAAVLVFRIGDSDFVLLALISFNVGIELGQLAVIGLALLAVGWFRERKWFRQAIVVPASCFIAFVGVYWTTIRILG